MSVQQEKLAELLEPATTGQVGSRHDDFAAAVGDIHPKLDLGEIVGTALDDVLFARNPLLRPRDACLEGAEVLLIGPGVWETQVTFARRASPPLPPAAHPAPSLEPSSRLDIRARIVYGNGWGQLIAAGQLLGPPWDQPRPARLRRGEVPPITFRIYDSRGREITTELGGGYHRITQILDLGPAAESVPELPMALPGESSFRYQKDNSGTGCWSCELDTSAEVFIAGNTYELQVRLNDGSLHACRFECE